MKFCFHESESRDLDFKLLISLNKNTSKLFITINKIQILPWAISDSLKDIRQNFRQEN